MPQAINFEAFGSSGFWIGALTVAGIYAVFTLGLQLNVGLTGILNFGQAGFMALGAYAMAIFIVKVHWPVLIALPVATMVAMLGALIIGLPALRLRPDYLAIVTLATAQIVIVTAQNTRDLTGGNDGIIGFDNTWIDIQQWAMDRLDQIGLGEEFGLPLLIMTWLTFGVLLFGLLLLKATPWGRVLRSIREDENAAEALGKNVYAYKLQSLAIAAAIGSIAGYLQALNITQVHPGSFDADFTFVGFAILVLGGLASYVGVAVGSILMWTVLEATRFMDLSLSADRVAALRLMIVGAVLIGIMMLRPQGILGKREEMVLRE